MTQELTSGARCRGGTRPAAGVVVEQLEDHSPRPGWTIAIITCEVKLQTAHRSFGHG